MHPHPHPDPDPHPSTAEATQHHRLGINAAGYTYPDIQLHEFLIFALRDTLRRSAARVVDLLEEWDADLDDDAAEHPVVPRGSVARSLMHQMPLAGAKARPRPNRASGSASSVDRVTADADDPPLLTASQVMAWISMFGMSAEERNQLMLLLRNS